MRHLRLAALAFVLFAAAGVTFAGATSVSTAAPKNLRGFLLRPDEPTVHSFPRTPSFAWAPVRGARCYEFELASSKSFVENSLVWSNVQYTVGRRSVCRAVPASSTTNGVTIGQSSSSTTSSGSGSGTTQSDPAVQSLIPPLRVPAASIDIALPWFTGLPYALYAHVRAVTSAGPTPWSKPFGFNMRWPDAAKPMQSQPGMIRWTPVEGATGYQVWYIEAGKVFSTHTNVADEREYYTFHPDPTWTSTVHWRIRAIRRVFGDIPNGLPAVSYGPWSSVYTATNPAMSSGPLTVKLAISDRVSNGRKQAAHELMPALTFTGTSVGGRNYGLFRAYAFTDRDCVNMVFRGAVVGGPAYAPRTSGPLKMPSSDADLEAALTSFLRDANDEGKTYTADGQKVVTNEAVASASSGTSSGSSSGGGSTGYENSVMGAKVDLPDLNFPTTRYYWTVVPVLAYVDSSGGIAFWDAEVPQDACAAGRVESFGKQSQPVVTAAGTPFVAGLTPSGRLLSAVVGKPVVYGTPLIAWRPAIAATAYQVEWSRSQYPWNPVGQKLTYSTSALLSLKPGQWFYRVRGLNLGQLRNPFMSWSTPVALRVAKPTFRVVASS